MAICAHEDIFSIAYFSIKYRLRYHRDLSRKFLINKEGSSQRVGLVIVINDACTVSMSCLRPNHSGCILGREHFVFLDRVEGLPRPLGSTS